MKHLILGLLLCFGLVENSIVTLWVVCFLSECNHNQYYSKGWDNFSIVFVWFLFEIPDLKHDYIFGPR